MTDRHTDELFDVPGLSAERIVFPVSRLVVDPERFLEDSKEPMAARGMGAVYERTSDSRPLRDKPSADERRMLIDRYYRPHHTRLNGAVDRSLARHGRCLIVDGHSFPSRPLPYEDDQDPDRPEICIGTDDFHTPEHLAGEAVAIFERAGFRTAVNRPFAGTIVPMAHYRRDPAVASIMVEVNRGLYMDEATGARLPVFEDLRRRLGDGLGLMAKCFLDPRREE